MVNSMHNLCSYSKRIIIQVLSIKMFHAIVLIWMIITLLHQCFWFKCSSSTLFLNTITSDQCTFDYMRYLIMVSHSNFTSFTSIKAYSAVAGPVSSSLYYLYDIQKQIN